MRSSGIISAGTEMTAPDLRAMLRIDCVSDHVIERGIFQNKLRIQ